MEYKGDLLMFKTFETWLFTLAFVISSTVWVQQSVPVVSVIISLASNNIKSGATIIVKAKVTNITNHALKMFIDTGHRAECDFKVTVRDGNGNLAPMTKKGKSLWNTTSFFKSGKHGDELLKPGESYIESVDLTELYDLKPGSYSVQLSDWVESTNTISLTVVP
jgi:hypothetical protein